MRPSAAAKAQVNRIRADMRASLTARYHAIFSGPCGIGKSQSARQILGDTACIISGHVSPLELYNLFADEKDNPAEARALRDGEKILVIDDNDHLFADPGYTAILKPLLDTGKDRVICWQSTTKELKGPQKIEVNAVVKFLTNIDMDRWRSGRARPTNDLERRLSRQSGNINWLLSRCHYLPLWLTPEEMFALVWQIAWNEGMLVARVDGNGQHAREVWGWLVQHWEQLREPDLRSVGKAADLRVHHADRWRKMCASSLIQKIPPAAGTHGEYTK